MRSSNGGLSASLPPSVAMREMYGGLVLQPCFEALVEKGNQTLCPKKMPPHISSLDGKTQPLLGGARLGISRVLHLEPERAKSRA